MIIRIRNGAAAKHAVALTVLYAKTGGPLLKGDLFVLVGVTLLEEARGAVFHGHQGDAEWSELRVGQGPGGRKEGKPSKCRP